ncbi:MAG: hypothetical protein AAF251_02640 [Pseudomonadota bacterium]
MPVMLTLPAVCAALVCAPADLGQDMTVAMTQETPATPAVPAATARSAKPKAVKMVEFDGAFDFLNMSRRLRIWRPAVQFDMKVDEEGHATECEVVDRFRKNYVNIKLCEVAMAHYTFEPARDAHNQAVEGSYRAKLSYKELREELD